MYNDLIANSCQSVLNSYFSFGSNFLRSSLTLLYKDDKILRYWNYLVISHTD